jgi:4-amino-4-deoxy-L-arabinose transferase-like glycosyltransferase
VIDRREWIAIAVVLALGVTVRTWRPWTLGLNHFDEGVYAITAAGLADGGGQVPSFPGLVRFAPPVYYSLVALSYTLTGHASDVAAVMVNVVTGSLTILAVWLVGRRWFTPATGVTAAAILALNEFHITFSRSGLTDITFLLLFITAVALIAAAIRRQSVAWAILAGVVVGAAWNTKYHGWFAVVAAAGALLPQVWRNRRTLPELYKPVGLLACVAATAALCYLPWAWYVETKAGGYAALAVAQRGLLSSAWLGNLAAQASMQGYFDGPFSRCALPLALTLSLFTLSAEQRSRRFLTVLILVSFASLILGSAATTLLLAAAAVPALIHNDRYESWMLLSWLALFFVSTPLYFPYARLLLPFVVGTHMAAAVCLTSVIAARPAIGTRVTPYLAAGVAAAVLVLSVSLLRTPADTWRPARSMADAASAMTTAIPPGERVVVVGEPPIGYYLHLTGHPTRFERIGDLKQLDDLREPVHVVTGIYAKRAEPLREALRRLEPRLIPVGTYRWSPSDVRLIDDLPPKAARAYVASPDGTFDLSLYRLMPASR